MRTVGDDGARGRRDVELRRESMPCVSASVTPELSPEQAVPHLLRDVLEHGRERGLLRHVHTVTRVAVMPLGEGERHEELEQARRTRGTAAWGRT
jgi:hypothetical protein